MDKKILELLLTLITDINDIKKVMVTKDDVKNFVTKDDVKNFVTKDDVKNFVTKDDVKNFVTKDDVKNFVTKDDLKITKEEFIKEIRDAEAFAIVSADKYKADKTEVEELSRRVSKIEQKLTH